MSKVIGVGGVFFKSPDPDALFAWYSRCLGDSGTGDGDGRANAHLVCSIMDGDAGDHDRGRDDFDFKLIVDDVDHALRTIAAEGGTIVGEAETYDDGRIGWFIDPEGNRVELWQPALN